MKNKIYTTLLFSGFCALILFIAACSHEPIFYDIAKEIKLEKATIQGNVHSIVKLKGDLYAANGNVYKKSVENERGWSEISKPNGHVVQLASDADYLYARTAWQTDEEGAEHGYKVWVLASTGWEPVPGAELSDAEKEKDVVIFDNAVVGSDTTTTGRNAYVRVGEVVNLLNGVTAFDSASSLAGTTTKTIAAATLGGTDYFADIPAFCSNGTTTLYKANGTAIQSSTDNGTTWTGEVNVDATPINFAFDALNNRILVGTEDGLQEVTLNVGVPAEARNLGSNAEAAIGESQIFSVATFGKGIIYVGASKQYSTKWNALWGYYPSRDNWNYE